MESVNHENINILGSCQEVEPAFSFMFFIFFGNIINQSGCFSIHFFENVKFNENGEVHTFPGTVSQLERALEMSRSCNGTFGLRHSLDW